MKLCIEIKKARKKVGLSIADAAYRLGIHPQTMYNYENGVTKPRKMAMIALGHVLDCNFFETENK